MKRWGFLMVLGACSLYGQWENPDKRLTIYPSCSDYGSDNNAWTIAVQDSLVHIVWEHRDGTNPGELYYVQSIDYGATFGPHQQLTTQNSHCPSICVFDSFVHIAWNDIRNGNYEIYYNRSSDYGASWDIDNFKLTNIAANSQYSSICCSDNYVHIAWQDERDSNSEIYYNRSSDYGTSWDIDNFRLTDDADRSEHPSICCSDSCVHMTWWDDRDGGSEIYYNRSSDYGTSWDIDNFRLTNNADWDWYPSICCSDGFIHIAWQGWVFGSKYEIYYNRSSDYGVSWDIDNFRLINNVANSQYPSICCSDSCVHIAWQDERDGNSEVYYNRSADYGANWIADERLTVDDSTSEYISVACTKCPYDVHIAWTDWRDGIEEIYYKRHKCPITGVSEDKELRVESLELRVFPNPSTTVVKVQWSGVSEGQKVSLKVYDLGGRLVNRLLNNEVISGNKIEVNLEKFAKGIYFVKMEADNLKATKKIILMR